jgi:signal transduction histidine kinase
MKILWWKLFKYFNVADSIAALSSCKLCRRIAFVVFIAILFIEGAILIPSVVNFERDLLKRLELEGFQTVQSIFRLSAPDAQPAEILSAANKQMEKSKLQGGVLFNKAGKLLGEFGEQIELDSNITSNPNMRMKEVKSGQRYEIVWTPKNTGHPYFIIARLDSSWIRSELIAFIGRIFGLVFLIAFFVTSVTSIIVGSMVLKPVLALRKNLIGAGRDPTNPDRYKINGAREDEMGDVIKAFNQMAGQIASDFQTLEEKEQELLHSKIMAERANEEKSSFLAKMSHELRTPLNAIIGFADIIKSEIMGPLGNALYKDYAKDIESSGQHLLALINDILDLSKAESGKLELYEEPFDIEDSVTGALRIIDPLAQKKSLIVDVNMMESLPPLFADERRFKQILLNLLSNAVKFTPVAGRVTVNINIGQAGELSVIIQDTGIGIPADKLPFVFEEFARVESIETKSIEGTGLGLPLTKRLIEHHDGRMDITSEAGSGTIVKFHFPACRLMERAA